MEHVVHRFRFRLEYHGKTAEHDGRIVEFVEGTFGLQIWIRAAGQALTLLEVQPVNSANAIWPLFRRLCSNRGIVVQEYRPLTDRGLGPWEPVPGGDETDTDPPAAASAPVEAQTDG